jgi:hypothetical protein
MTTAARSRYACYRFPAEIISHDRLAVFPLSACVAHGRRIAGLPRHRRQPRCGRPGVMVTDKLDSYDAAKRDVMPGVEPPDSGRSRTLHDNFATGGRQELPCVLQVRGLLCRSVLNCPQAKTASTTLTDDSVATTRLRRKPALSSRGTYSASVRSWPPSSTSITMSSILPGCGASP